MHKRIGANVTTTDGVGDFMTGVARLTPHVIMSTILKVVVSMVAPHAAAIALIPSLYKITKNLYTDPGYVMGVNCLKMYTPGTDERIVDQNKFIVGVRRMFGIRAGKYALQAYTVIVGSKRGYLQELEVS